MNRKAKILTGAAVLAVGLLLSLASCEQVQPAATETEPSPVSAPVLRIEAQQFVDSVAITGALVSKARVDVKAETVGRIVRFPKEQGDTVAAGEAVAWVDEENYQIAVHQAETAVQVADATLARAGVVQTHADSELERAQNLVKSGGITDQDLKSAEVAAQEAAAQVALAGAQLEQARASLAQAQKRLRDTAIVAPVGGTIETKHVNTGAYVEMSTPVITIVDNSQLELLAPIPTAQLGRVAAGQTARFGVNSYPETIFEGRIVDISPAVDSQTRAIAVRIQVDNSSRKLKAGMFAQGEIITGVEENAIVIPAAAVYRTGTSGEGAYVYVVNGGSASRREIRIASETGTSIVVADGLAPGDLLVTEQSIELADGIRVQPEG